MPDKTAKNNNLTCLFSEKDHIYTVKETGQLLKSVTTVINQYTPPFEAQKMAQRMVDKQKPAYTGMNTEQIIQKWKEKAALSSKEGTLIHNYLEQWPVKRAADFFPVTYRVFLMCQQVNKLFPKLMTRFHLVESEKFVFSPSLGVAGQIDLLMFDDETEEGIIIDWKSNSKITDESGAFGTLQEPLEHLKNCDVVKYGLQLGLYEKILTDEEYYPEFKGYRKTLIHVQEKFGRVIKVSDYKEEIECLML